MFCVIYVFTVGVFFLLFYPAIFSPLPPNYKTYKKFICTNLPSYKRYWTTSFHLSTNESKLPYHTGGLCTILNNSPKPWTSEKECILLVYLFFCVIVNNISVIHMTRETGRDLTRSYDKSPYANRKVQKAKLQPKYVNKNFDYTKIANRLRTVSRSNDSHPTGVVKPVYEIPTFLPTTNAL